MARKKAAATPDVPAETKVDAADTASPTLDKPVGKGRRWRVCSPVRHDGKDFAEDDDLVMDADQAGELVAAGVLSAV